MKLKMRIPFLFGLVVLITALGMGIVMYLISSSNLESVVVESIGDRNESNAELISVTLNGQLDILQEIANRARSRTMDWEQVQPSLLPDITRIGATDMSLIYPNGISYDVRAGNTLDLSDREYFKKAMTGEKTIEVVFSRQSNSLMVMFAVPVYPNDQPGAPVIGVIVAAKDGSRTLSNIVINLKSSMPSAYSYLINNQGTAIAHPNNTLVTNEFNPIKEAASNSSYRALANLVENALIERNGFGLYTFDGKVLIGKYNEVPGYPWLLFSSIEQDDIKSYLIYLRNVAVIVGLAFFLFGIILAIFIGGAITRPVREVVDTLKDISEGEGDLTHAIHEVGKDELTELAFYFNKTFGNIRNMITIIKHKVGALTNTGHELSVNMTKTSNSVDDISKNFENIQDLEEKQHQGSIEVDKSLNIIRDNIDYQAKLIEEQTESVNTSSSAIEEMTANIHSVNKSLVENNKCVENLADASEEGRTALQGVVQKILDIAKDSEGLLEINSVMDNIAAQTNLLSMNAAIEAAHAGEAGKGFAVVADEIRKLAESSSQQSKTTASMLKKIKTSIDSITKSSNDVLSRFEAIDNGVKTVTEHEVNIRNAMEEQAIGGQQILESVGRLKEITISVQKGSEKMSDSGTNLIRETDSFIKLSSDAIKGMNDIVNGALKEIKVAVTHVTEMSEKNNQNFGDLKSETLKFKVTTGNEKKKVLVIDDDRNHLTMTKSFLDQDYEVITVETCEEALRSLFNGLIPNFILLDLMMPEVDGWETFERLKRITVLNKTPLAIFTSSDDPADQNKAREMGAIDYIRKPCKKSELLERLDKHINK
ncbi:MAG: methyl-accepting chemotaxis protein [Treponema sp.]|nr:methyl-accepting chemotaxis protein [Treponema sp.]